MRFLYDKLEGSYWKKILPATSSAPESAPVPIQLRYFKACLFKNIMLKCIWERRFFLQCLAWLCCIVKAAWPCLNLPGRGKERICAKMSWYLWCQSFTSSFGIIDGVDELKKFGLFKYTQLHSYTTFFWRSWVWIPTMPQPFKTRSGRDCTLDPHPRSISMTLANHVTSVSSGRRIDVCFLLLWSVLLWNWHVRTGCDLDHQ